MKGGCEITNRKKDTRSKEGRLALEPQKKSEKVAPKIEPLPGYLMVQYKRCGQSNCKCANGFPHGPYHYRVWTVNGVRKKQYIKKSEVPMVEARTTAYREQKAKERAKLRAFNILLAQMRQKERECSILINEIIKGEKL